MKRKIVLLFFVLLLVLTSGNLFAQNLNGVALGLGYTGNAFQSRWAGGMVTFHVPQSPLIFDVYPYLGSGGFGLTLTGDLWLVRNPIAGPFHWYLGPGLWVDLGFGSVFSLGIGARLAIGLQLWLINQLEIFLEAAPGLGLYVIPAVGFAWPVPVTLGFRWWF